MHTSKTRKISTVCRKQQPHRTACRSFQKQSLCSWEWFSFSFCSWLQLLWKDATCTGRAKLPMKDARREEQAHCSNLCLPANTFQVRTITFGMPNELWIVVVPHALVKVEKPFVHNFLKQLPNGLKLSLLTSSPLGHLLGKAE